MMSQRREHLFITYPRIHSQSRLGKSLARPRWEFGLEGFAGFVESCAHDRVYFPSASPIVSGNDLVFKLGRVKSKQDARTDRRRQETAQDWQGRRQV